MDLREASRKCQSLSKLWAFDESCELRVKDFNKITLDSLFAEQPWVLKYKC